MNEYAKGALEALAWVQSLMSNLRKEKTVDLKWQKLKQNVDAAQGDLLKGIAVDFRFRIEKGV